jgi:hypothetical protein
VRPLQKQSLITALAPKYNAQVENASLVEAADQ